MADWTPKWKVGDVLVWKHPDRINPETAEPYPPVYREIVEVRPGRGYSWRYPDMPDEYFSENSNDEQMLRGWQKAVIMPLLPRAPMKENPMPDAETKDAKVAAEAYGLSAKEAVNRLTDLLKKEGMEDLIPNIRVIEPVAKAEDGKLYWNATTVPLPGEPKAQEPS